MEVKSTVLKKCFTQLYIVGCRLLKKEETKAPDADTAEVNAWQEAVLFCQTASQLAVCMNLLNKKIIAWEKSTTKVFCLECRRGDNESLLLLCGGCDKQRHTYCCTVSKSVRCVKIVK